MTLLLFDVPLIAVVEISVVSSRLFPPARLATASSTVPALSSANRTSRADMALAVPRVAPDGTTSDSAEETLRVLTVPLHNVAERKSSEVGFRFRVNALADTLALIDCICLLRLDTP